MFKGTQKLKMLVLSALLITGAAGASMAQQVDLTHYFAKKTMHLADSPRMSVNAERISRGEVAFSSAKPAEVGDKAHFNAFNLELNRNEKITAVLRKIGKHCYIYVENGKKVSSEVINKIANEFDNRIYPEDRSMFGEEWSPGIDDDKRITLFLLDIRDGYNPEAGRNGFVGGYFNAGDCYTKSKEPTSNQREMLYLDIYPGKAGDRNFLSTVAHEFQHMIHWNHDPKEFTWVNESLSQLAPYLCGYGHPSQLNAFVREPDNNLVAWSEDTMIANYGQVYLWSHYLSTRLADTDAAERALIRSMVDQKSQGLSGINSAIKKQGIKNNIKNIFRSFCVANYLNDDRIAGGIYGYNKDLSRLFLKPQLRMEQNPYSVSSSVKCWSCKGIQVNPKVMRGKQVQVSFRGQTIAANDYKNSMDLALIHYSLDRSVLPVVQWVRVKANNYTGKINIPAEHDRMIALVINRGPEAMKAEQAYACNVMPAKFNLAFAPTGEAARIASNKSTKSKSKTSKKTKKSTKPASSKNIMEMLSADMNELESAKQVLTAESSDQASKESAAVKYDLASQRLSALEKQILGSLKIKIKTDNSAFIFDFILALAEKDDNEKQKYAELITGITAILQFEQSQGNEKAGELLGKFQGKQY